MKKRTSLSISARRHFVDNFFFSHVELFKSGASVIDIGGKKANKRGLFDISKYGAEVTYVNIEKRDEPDIIADAASIPLPDGTFNICLMGELLEHVPDPRPVVREAYRLLSPGGVLLATVPFNVGIHADPYDFGRYTDYFWKNLSEDVGFSSVEVERHGTIFAVAALMLQHLFLAKGVSWRPIQVPLVKFLMWLDKRTSTPLLTAWTTGFGLTFVK